MLGNQTHVTVSAGFFSMDPERMTDLCVQ